MYALSVKQPRAELIARGTKRIEYRSWMTRHRGDLVAITTVTGSDGDYRWHLADPRRVKPLPLRGYAALYKVPDERIEVVSAPRARGRK